LFCAFCFLSLQQREFPLSIIIVEGYLVAVTVRYIGIWFLGYA
jgi:hypothetical protein